MGKCAIAVPVCLGTRRTAFCPGFSRMIERAAIAADLDIKGHAAAPCGGYGHDTRAIRAHLGHRNIQNTTRYTALVPQTVQGVFSRLIAQVDTSVLGVTRSFKWEGGMTKSLAFVVFSLALLLGACGQRTSPRGRHPHRRLREGLSTV